MTEHQGPIIWLIDEDERQLRTYRSLLQKALPKDANLRVEGISARTHVSDYFDLLKDSRTVCIVVDQRLNEAKHVDHTGIQLAKELRAVDAKLPIYILTNHVDDKDEFVGGEWSVDDIISKEEISKKAQLRTFIARLIRRLDIHQAILGAREERFRTLLKKSMYQDLSEDEQKELDELEFQRSAATVASENEQLRTLEEALKQIGKLSAGIGKAKKQRNGSDDAN